MTMKMSDGLSDEFSANCRVLEQCVACGQAKPAGLLVCWDCLRYGKHDSDPLQYADSSASWFRRYADTGPVELVRAERQCRGRDGSETALLDWRVTGVKFALVRGRMRRQPCPHTFYVQARSAREARLAVFTIGYPHSITKIERVLT